MWQSHDVAIDPPEALLSDLAALRAGTRAARHAYWLPAGVFGLLVCASAPLYVTPEILCDGSSPCSYSVLQPVGSVWLAGLGGGVVGLFWAFVLLAGALVTAGWYTWYGRVTGLATRVRWPVASWMIGLIVAAGALTATALLGLVFGFIAVGRGFFPLLVIGVGLIALGVLERSRSLIVTSILVSAWAVLVSLYNVENLLYRLLSLVGIPDSHMPYNVAPTIDVLVPGILLLITAATAFAADLRRR